MYSNLRVYGEKEIAASSGKWSLECIKVLRVLRAVGQAQEQVARGGGAGAGGGSESTYGYQ